MSEQAVMAQFQRRYLQSVGLLGLLLLASLAFDSLLLLVSPAQRNLLSLGLNSALGGVYAGLMAIVLPAALLQSYREWYLTRSLRAAELSRLAWRSFWPWWLGLSTLALLAGFSLAPWAADFTVTGPDGKPLALAMVTRTAVQGAPIDASDNDYPASGLLQQGVFEHTRFSDAQGRVALPDTPGAYRVRLRKPGYRDRVIEPDALARPASWRM